MIWEVPRPIPGDEGQKMDGMCCVCVGVCVGGGGAGEKGGSQTLAEKLKHVTFKVSINPENF